MRKLFIKIIIIVAFAFYWICTFIYVMPSNYIRIKANTIVILLDIFFPQRWTFFAPPPSYNYRLYYVFEKDGQTKIIEVIKPLIEAKKQNAPFNTNEEIVDYVINGSITAIQNQMAMYKNAAEKDTIRNDSLVIEKVNKELPNLSEYKTLYNYSKIVAERNNIKPYKCIVYFYASYVKIPKFSERNNSDNAILTESLVFKSKKYQLQ
jgi:hypothetical protein